MFQKHGERDEKNFLQKRTTEELRAALQENYATFVEEHNYRMARPDEKEYEEFKRELERAVAQARAEYVHEHHKPRSWRELSKDELRAADDPVDNRVVELLRTLYPRRYDALAYRHQEDFEY